MGCVSSYPDSLRPSADGVVFSDLFVNPKAWGFNLFISCKETNICPFMTETINCRFEANKNLIF